MDIGGINRIKAGTAALPTELKKSGQSATDRDAQGNTGYSKQKKPTHLTPEQEVEALAKLNAMPAFAKSGLRAELVRQQDDKAAHIIIIGTNGEVVRHLPYEQIVDLYINRNSDNTTGRLLRSAA